MGQHYSDETRAGLEGALPDLETFKLEASSLQARADSIQAVEDRLEALEDRLEEEAKALRRELEASREEGLPTNDVEEALEEAVRKVRSLASSLEDIRRDIRTDAIDPWYQAEGWYYRSCFPGCLPDSEPIGPFASEEEALEDARRGLEE